MNMRYLMLAILLVHATGSIAQLVERCTQNSVTGTWHSVERWNDTLWLFTGAEHDLVPFGSRATFLTMDTSGTIGNGGWFNMPGHPFTALNAATAHDDRPAVLAGWVQTECVAFPQGYLARMAPTGAILWNRTLNDAAIMAVADPDTFIHAASGDDVVVLSRSGDSLTTVTSSQGTVTRMSTVDTLSALACDQGAVILAANGSEVAARAYVNGVDAILGYEGVGYALLSNGWLYRTDLDLVPFDSTEHGDVGGTPVLCYDLSFLWVIGQDTARLFDPGLNPTSVLAMEHPDGYYEMLDAAPGGTVLMTCGDFVDGPLAGPALRGVDKLGAPNVNDIDVRLSTIGYTPFNYQPLPGPPGWFEVTGSASVYLVNEGTVPVNAATIVHLSAFNLACESQNVLSGAATPLLDPGDSAITYIAGIVDTVSWSTPNVEICLRVAAPMLLMDRNTTNDEVCGSVDVFASIGTTAAHQGWAVFPNPCSDRFVVRDRTGATVPGNLIIRDGSGRTVARVAPASGTVDVTGLANGPYLLCLPEGGPPVPFVIAR